MSVYVYYIGIFCLWPYHPECARSHLISEAKQGRAWSVLGWETFDIFFSLNILHLPRLVTVY